jgi:hypothetical protein
MGRATRGTSRLRLMGRLPNPHEIISNRVSIDQCAASIMGVPEHGL